MDIKEDLPYWDSPDEKNGPKKYIGVYWRCCRVFSRAYQNNERTHYVGSCPSCGKVAKARAGKDGTNRKFFYAE